MRLTAALLKSRSGGGKSSPDGKSGFFGALSRLLEQELWRVVAARSPGWSGDERDPFMDDSLDPRLAATRPGSVRPILALPRRRGLTRGRLAISEAAVASKAEDEAVRVRDEFNE